MIPISDNLMQLDLRIMSAMCFTIPEKDIGISDVEIYVEYNYNAEEKILAYNTWASVGNKGIRGQISSGLIEDFECSDDDIHQKLLTHINTSDQFDQRLSEYIDFVTQTEE